MSTGRTLLPAKVTSFATVVSRVIIAMRPWTCARKSAKGICQDEIKCLLRNQCSDEQFQFKDRIIKVLPFYWLFLGCNRDFIFFYI